MELDEVSRKWWHYPLLAIFWIAIWPVVALNFLFKSSRWEHWQAKVGEPKFSVLVIISGWLLLAMGCAIVGLI